MKPDLTPYLGRGASLTAGLSCGAGKEKCEQEVRGAIKKAGSWMLLAGRSFCEREYSISQISRLVNRGNTVV